MKWTSLNVFRDPFIKILNIPCNMVFIALQQLCKEGREEGKDREKLELRDVSLLCKQRSWPRISEEMRAQPQHRLSGTYLVLLLLDQITLEKEKSRFKLPEKGEDSDWHTGDWKQTEAKGNLGTGLSNMVTCLKWVIPLVEKARLKLNPTKPSYIYA